MELQILDADYILLNNKPIIRLFCKDIQGETVCVFYDKFLPYFYLHGEETKYPEIIDEIKNKYDVKIEIVEKILPIGFQPPVKVLKIVGTNPRLTPEMRSFVKNFGIPYEADILFRYRFMADHGLKGMGWINVKGKFRRTNTVKCKAISAESIEPIEIMKNAPLKYMSVDIECLPSEERIASPEKDKIIVISMAFSPNYKGKSSLVLIAKPARINENSIACKNEEDMLKKFKEIIDEYDSDIICGHNINGFDLPFLIKRMEILKIPRDLGRSEKFAIARKLQRSYMPNVCGRVVVDTFEIFRRDPWVKFKRYDLSTISEKMLGIGKIEFGKGNYIKKVRETWNGNDFREIIEYGRRDAVLALRLVVEKRLLDKFFEIAKLSGLVLQDSLGGQTQRHEFRLLREFYKRNFIMPCKLADIGDRLKQHGLKGALVLEPEIGFHEWVICLDFTSMYPSLIRAFNICTTTYLTNGENVEHFVSPYGTKFVKPSVFKGIIPQIVDEIMSSRVEVRKQYKLEIDSENKRILKAKQLALKDLLNSVHPETDIVVKSPSGKIMIIEISRLFDELSKNNTIKKIKDDIDIIELSRWQALSVDGDRACFKPLYAISRHKNKDNLIKIRTRMGEVKITKNHSIIEMLGNKSNRIRNTTFHGLNTKRGNDVTYDTIIAQVNNVNIETTGKKYLNLIDILLSLPEKEIKNLCLFIPRHLNLNKREWFKNRVKLFKYLKEIGLTNSVKIQNDLGFDRRVLRRTENMGIEKIETTTVGNCGMVPVYSITEEAENYLSFYEIFGKAKETNSFYVIPIKNLKNVRIPLRILNNSKIAVYNGMRGGRKKINVLIPITKELAEFFGWYVSEGNSYKNEQDDSSYYYIQIVNNNKSVLKRLVKLAKSIFNYDAKIYNDQIHFNLKILYLLFGYLAGHNSYEKRIPDFIINSPREIRDAFLTAYTEGDGNKNGRRLSTKSKILASQLSFLLKEHNCILHNSKDSNIFRISKRKFVHGEKIVSGNLFGQPPIKIEEIEPTDYVYDLSVKDTEKFVTAQGIILHNSLYGYTGYVRSRLYVMNIANTITAFGRDTITKTKKLIEENFPAKVIYADTDSVFIKSNYKDLDKAMEFGRKISDFISGKLYGLDLKFEKIFKTFLIETKKRYAGWTFERERDKWVDRLEMKGIETVRRDWCDLVSETTLEVLNIILKERNINKASKYVRTIIDKLAKGKISLEELTIVKGVTKALDAYDGVQPHVELAKKIMKRDKTRSLVGERLGYVIIRGNQLLSKRAEDPAYVKEKGLQIDSEYYIYNQLLPPLERIFDVCGISSSELIEGVRQTSLLDIINGSKKKSPDETVLNTFESVICKNCGWEFRRPTLTGKCPECSGRIYFSANGSMGAMVDFSK